MLRNEHFGYNLEQPDSLLIQIFVSAFQIGLDNFYEKYLSFDWKQMIGWDDAWEFVFDFCKVIEIDWTKAKKVEELYENITVTKK